MTRLLELTTDISACDRKITKAGQDLLGLQNERRSLILEARKLELQDLPEPEQFKLKYHHAVQDVREAEKATEEAAKRNKVAKDEELVAFEALAGLEEQTEEDEAAEEERNLPIIQQTSNGELNESWRELSIETLNLSESILDKLRNPIHKHSDKKLGEITTLGGIVDLTTGGNIAYSQLKGISSTTSGKIEDAWMEFWQSHPEYCQKPADETVIVEGEQDQSEGIAVLKEHGLQDKQLNLLKSGGIETIANLQEIIEDDDLLGDVVGKKQVKKVREIYESWSVIQ